MRALALVACITVLACGSTPAAPSLPYRVIGHGNLADTGGPAPASLVIRDAGSWTSFKEESALRAPSFRPEDPIPPVSFPDEMVVVLMLGQRPTTGYEVRVNEVRTRSGDVVVDATEVWPCVGATVITHPLTAIAVPRSDGAVSVLWSRAPNCR